MKEFMVVTQEEGPCHTELSPKGIGKLVCKNLPKNMSKSVTNARGILNIHQLGGTLNTLSSPWPFAQ